MEEVLDPSQPPSDFAEYEKWVNAQAAPKEAVPDKPAEAPAKADAAKTDPNSEAEADQEHDDDEDVTPAKKSGFARRIDKLNQKIGAEKARADALERQLQGGNATQKPEKPAAAAEPAGRPKETDFDSYAEFVDKLTDWKMEQRETARAAEAATQKAAQSQAEQKKAWNEKVNTFKSETPDYNDVLQAAEDIQVSPAMNEAIITSDHGPAIAYHLAQHPEEAQRIAALSPVAAAREIGKIEAALAAETATPAPKARVSKAPAPAKTVKAAAESSEPDPSDFNAWERWRNAQPGASLRR